MRTIAKKSEPKTLTQHRASVSQPYTRQDFDNYQHKDQLRKNILTEQGHICCYCMRRITADTMKIEHREPVSGNPNLTLDYSNLLGACLGGEGEPYKNQHCDTHKGNDSLTINPVNKGQCERTIRYTPTGEMVSDNDQVNNDLNETLNLNLDWLKKNRQKTFESIIEGLKRTRPTGTWSRQLIEQQIRKWNTPTNEFLHEYCQVAIYALKKKLKQPLINQMNTY